MTDLVQDHTSLTATIEELAALARAGASPSEVLSRQFDLGLAWPGFPPGCGGRGLDSDRAAEVAELLDAAHLPPTPTAFVGHGLVAPMLAEHGSTEQQALLRSIFTGEHRWCQLFSEPSAGSDLANISTTASNNGETWIIRGQKVWNSFAQDATHAILLTRSDPSLPKHRGITMFLLDMRSSGVTVRPLRDMTGDAHFNQVFLDDVLVADDYRLGPINEGWRMALEVLRHERTAIGKTASNQPNDRTTPIDHLVARARDSGVRSQERDRIVDLWVKSRVIEFARSQLRSGDHSIGLDEVSLRVLFTEHNFAVLNLAVDLSGPEGMLGRSSDAEWDVAGEFLYSRGLMIGGGTLEICRNLIAERLLGLPGEPRIDKDRPWREVSGVGISNG